MNFNSPEYYAFLPIAIVAYFLAPRRLKNPLTLIASYFFYACWEPVYALLMLASTVATYFCAILADSEALGRRKTWLALCLVANLLVLFMFKYFNFATDIIARTLSLAFGAQIAHPVSGLLLPVGISFYTFQALGYTMDVYRKKLHAEKNFVDYALFVSFFPQLVAGPIERSSNLLPQLKRERRFSFERLCSGATLLFFGLFKKIVIADNLAALVNYAYEQAPGSLGGFQYAVAAAAFSVQIYCDFSAYSDIARGSARAIGVELMKNFDAPYLSTSIKEFWRRWHISLSTWFKDYLYFPLGGSRCKSEFRRYLNLFIVFLVSGLWHGAALTFVAWGALHGAFQTVSTATQPLRTRLLAPLLKRLRARDDALLLRVLRMAFNFVLVSAAFVFFRAESVTGAAGVIASIIKSPLTGSPFELGLSSSELLVTAVAVAVLLAYDVASQKTDIVSRVSKRPAVRYAVWFFLLTTTLVFGYYGDGFNPQEFIYFQF